MRDRIITVTFNPALDRTFTVEGFRIGELNRALSARIDAGGKGINVARALRRFGMDVLAAGMNGGASGKLLESIVGGEGIPYEFYQVAGETRTNTKISDLETGVTTELNEQGFHVDAETLEGFLKRLRELARNAGYLVLSGSLPQGAPAGIYADLIETYRKDGIKVILDADNDPLRFGVEAIPYAIKPNLRELSCIAGRPVSTDRDIIDEAGRLLKTGVELVVVTMGERGAILVSKDECIIAKPFPIKPVCTTGAGDAALSAMIYCGIHGMPLSETAAFMVCAGTLSSTLPGTAACSLDDISKCISKVQVDRITEKGK